MALDFSNLRNMAASKEQQAPATASQAADIAAVANATPLEWDDVINKDPKERKQKTDIAAESVNTSQTQKNSPKTHERAKVDQKDTGADSMAYNALQGEQRERERMRRVYSEYQQNIKKSELAQAQLLKGMKAGADCETLLFIAVECIAHMTNNSLFMEQFMEAAAQRVGTQKALF